MNSSNRHPTRIAALALTVASLAGCGDANIRKLDPGIARDSVKKILALGSTAAGDSTPNVYREERYLHNGHWITIMMYSKTGKKEGGPDVIPEGDLTPVVLLDDTLTGWGWAHHDSVAIANNIIIKPRDK
jgi:hypothetical protein